MSSPTVSEVLTLLERRAYYKEALESTHLSQDHGMLADNLTRVTAQIEGLKWRDLATFTTALTPSAPAASIEADPKMEALYRACRSAADNIAEFGHITDGEVIWDLGNALDALTPSTPPAPADDWERIEIPFTFSGGIVSIPALRDPSDGERFYSPDAVQIMYNLMHHLTPPTTPSAHFALEPGEGVILPAGRLRLESVTEGAACLVFEALRAEEGGG